MNCLRRGEIQHVFKEAMAVDTWSDPSSRPTSPDMRKAQEASDNDNFSKANKLVTNNLGVAALTPTNIKAVDDLFVDPLPPLQLPPLPVSNGQSFQLPGDIIKSIRRAPRTTGAGINCDTIDSFVDLVSLNNAAINEDIRALFNYIYCGHVPEIVAAYLRDSYLFCLHKDPEDDTKLRPIQIPLALRRLLANHVADWYKGIAAFRLAPFNMAIGIKGGMDFIIKTMQLSVEKHIIEPQSRRDLPSRAIVFLDLKNMFNNISREKLLHIIGTHFPELVPLATILYGLSGKAHYRWHDGSWRWFDMDEGANQGCPLSGMFASLVLHHVLVPLDMELQQRAADRLANNDRGDDGHGSVATIMSYVDDVTGSVPHVDMAFFERRFKHHAEPLGGFWQTKSRILTSCDGSSIIPRLRAANRVVADELENMIARCSNKPSPNWLRGICH